MNRRQFVNYTGSFMSLGAAGLRAKFNKMQNIMQAPSPINIKNTDLNFEREPLHPYRFKGSAITEAWQVAALLESENGTRAIGLGGQSVLWSDAKVFSQHSVNGGN